MKRILAAGILEYFNVKIIFITQYVELIPEQVRNKLQVVIDFKCIFWVKKEMIIISHSPEETISIGVRIGEKLKRGNTVCLSGDLGSGKTTLIKGIARNFGLKERDITSASFTIISEYDSLTPFYHIDLYRLDDMTSVDDIGLEEYISGDGVAVIEWADKVKEHIECNVSVILEYGDGNNREIIIEGIDEKDWNHI